MGEVAATGGVRFSVQHEGREVLVYHVASLAEAREIFDFVRDFFPGARFVFEPALH